MIGERNSVVENNAHPRARAGGCAIAISATPLLAPQAHADWFDGKRSYDQGYWLRWNFSPFGDGASTRSSQRT